MRESRQRQRGRGRGGGERIALETEWNFRSPFGRIVVSLVKSSPNIRERLDKGFSLSLSFFSLFAGTSLTAIDFTMCARRGQEEECVYISRGYRKSAERLKLGSSDGDGPPSR